MSGMDRLSDEELNFWTGSPVDQIRDMARELLAHRRASQATPAPSDGLREALDEVDHALGQMGIFEDASIRVKLKRARAALSSSPAQEGGE